ncbi:chromosome segregation protein SMC [Sphingomonas spermidinifaciens]|uniref:Chromosome partition protein Smc n=1 Tax=Sphingomonas spermidinifaciens TaxID=1141889 RepID=A0A2A4B944_9SPHN|nr:chromosome segregation protein SMC [Sphingomonas spermidinifaciens]PCD04166.1 chromosome segregation protein SMC [Sphingomonas spermidinifaciens]
MQITRLRLTGFKSFVDPADLRIEPGLTGVVGPNGCGKSNLLEALRWAMGESSARSLRGAGMEDVIFAGTATRPQRDFAEVAIHAVAGDDEEVEVVRRIERGAGSAYRLNGRDVRARDVALLFADAATGAHSPALVSQNRIGAVIAAKPVERRAMLEEAAGIAGLHVRRKEAETRLRATESNLQRLGELITDQDTRIAALRRQARQAERYRALSDQVRTAEGRLIFARWRDAAAAADAARAEAKAADARVAEASAAHEAANAAQVAAQTTLAEARAAAQAARDAAGEAQHALENLARERRGVERRLDDLTAAAARLTEDRAREGDLAQDAADAIARLGAEAAALETRIAADAARLPTLDAALAGAERAARDAEVALAQALAAQAQETAEVRVADAALAAARQRLDRAQRDAARVAAEAAGLGDAAPLEAQGRAAALARRQSQERAAAARRTLAEAEANERAAIEGRQRADAQRATAQAELAALDSEAAVLARATRPGPRARLLDRVRAAPGYERALAAALGDDLEAGVDAAEDRHWAGAEPQPGDPAAPAGTATLAAHVEAPPALARRLSQIFVVEADDARPLAVGQRLVTLAGVLRRWDGFVARGSGAAAAERLERLNRLRALEAARPAAVRAVESAEAETTRIAATIAEARATASEARRVIEASERAEREAARDEDRAAAALERLSAQAADLAQRKARTAADANETEGEVARAEAAIAALPDGSATRERVRALSAAAETARTAVSEARTQRAALDRSLAFDRERRAAAQAEAKGWRARAGEAAKRIADLDKRAAEGEAERLRLAGRPALLLAQQADADARAREATAAATTSAAAERTAEAALREAEATARGAAEALAAARESRAGAAARAENQDLRRVEMGRVSGERFECPPPLLPERAGFDAADVGNPQDESARHDRLVAERERIGPVNLIAERELAELAAEREKGAAEIAELEAAVHRLRGSIGTLNREGRQRLLAAFEAVDGHFRRLFTTLFDGGQAHLTLIDSDDPLEAGLEIMAQPPGKKLQSLTLLSGGEQALTAVALIFGLFLTNPAPICVLDEVDAPLDDANIDRFCDLLDRMTQETATRYLIVTHNAATMSRMHRLFGVTMVERGVSRLVSVDLSAAETLIAAE